MGKFGFSLTTPRKETFTIVNCDSFDEAIKLVERGVYERNLKLEEASKKDAAAKTVTPVPPPPSSTAQTPPPTPPLSTTRTTPPAPPTAPSSTAAHSGQQPA